MDAFCLKQTTGQKRDINLLSKTKNNSWKYYATIKSIYGVLTQFKAQPEKGRYTLDSFMQQVAATNFFYADNYFRQKYLVHNGQIVAAVYRVDKSLRLVT